MGRLKIFIEVDGHGFDHPCGLSLDFGEVKDELLTPERYKKFQTEVKISEVLELASLSEMADLEKCRVISPDEYMKKYGEE